MSTGPKREYRSASRAKAAEATRVRVLGVAKRLFAKHGIDGVTIDLIAEKAKVASSTATVVP